VKRGPAPRRDRVDGILLLDKPKGLSSNDALMRARRLLNALKAGHGGTLDPMATGLLPLMLGEATKFAQDALDADKTYVAELTLGITTSTADAEGEVLLSRPVQCDEAAVRSACAGFAGEIDQVPPMYSALKRDGKPLYEYARAGIELERSARRITIHSIEVLSYAEGGETPRATLRVTCSKGTYIRTLVADIGEVLGCGAHLSALRRERVGELSIDAAIGLDELEAVPLAERRERLDPVDALIVGLPRIDLDPPTAARFLNGQRLPAQALGTSPAAELFEGRRLRVYADARLVGLADWRNGVLAPRRLIAVPEPVPDRSAGQRSEQSAGA
jgi:tRNA pseudouridine55 synthase